MGITDTIRSKEITENEILKSKKIYKKIKKRNKSLNHRKHR